MEELKNIPATPSFVLEYQKFQRNLDVISDIQNHAPCRFLFALKGFAMHRVFEQIAQTASGAAASSLNEARLAREFFPQVHAYAPVYIPKDFPEIAAVSDHVTFNSLRQYEQYRGELQGASAGIRINPEYSSVETDLYNPCIPGSRLGVQAADLPSLPEGISGLHSHNLCESGEEDLKLTLEHIERLFSHLLPDISWLNLGGGHLVTRDGYRTDILKQVLQEFHDRHPHIELILEPGAAFVWETGVLVAEVLDLVESGGITTAMLDASFAAHMPDCIEMPYTPRIRDARTIDRESPESSPFRYRMGGATCLAGDTAGDYLFDRPLHVGDRVVFEDMMHYTMVKTNMFNGIGLPDIGIWHHDTGYELVRSFEYEDYRNRLS